MISFYIHARRDTEADVTYFYWKASKLNGSYPFFAPYNTFYTLKSVVRSIKNITKHMKDGHYQIVLSDKANVVRKTVTNEPTYGTMERTKL